MILLSRYQGANQGCCLFPPRIEMYLRQASQIENDKRTENGGGVFITFQSAYFMEDGEEIPLIKWGWTSTKLFDLMG